jgi:hypothetical protein
MQRWGQSLRGGDLAADLVAGLVVKWHAVAALQRHRQQSHPMLIFLCQIGR